MVISRLPTKPRLALYSHDAQGLGHIRRNLTIAGVLAAGGQRDVLVISGASKAGAFALPPGVELLTLPALRKSSDGDYRARSLALPLAGLIRLRAQTICAALEQFAPDVLIVDKLPLGIKGELEPALDLLCEIGTTRLVLGLREVLDDPATVRREWASGGPERRAMREIYDAIWVYGDRGVYDPTVEYELDAEIAAKVRFSGYLGRDPGGSGDPPSDLPPGDVAACLVGGGQDGFELARAFARSPMPVGTTGIVVTGPFMPAEDRQRLERLAGERRDMRVLRFVEDPGTLLRHAQRVVCMGGYNTVCELLHLGHRPLVVPRVRPRLEQLIRAERLAARGVVDLLHPDALTPAAIGAWLARALGIRPHPRQCLDLDGLLRIPALLDELHPRIAHLYEPPSREDLRAVC